jgi:hypothetical protein
MNDTLMRLILSVWFTAFFFTRFGLPSPCYSMAGSAGIGHTEG